MTGTTIDGSDLSAADEEAVRDLIARADAARAEPAALPALHAPGAVVVDLAVRRVLGRDPLAVAPEEAMASPLRDGADPRALRCTGAPTHVVARSEQGWRIVLAQTTPLAGPSATG
ncbi:hypothetical protein [Kineococcus aurantiacus]|uniref:Uncharacterized protein n=1 Tax=Kineococcus aurantiacus TaxID=37633 RepID=A0A7Y9DQC3_9ACTN|nr:hypothetical protein [Kineococcus aurantiacus]NYD24867.1 hypothetical protein [Kineococcus aurantiacus]